MKEEKFILMDPDDLKEAFAEYVKSLYGELPQKQTPVQDKFLTRDEACARLHVSSTTIWRMVKRGHLHVHKVGRRNFYSQLEIDDLFTNGVPAESQIM